MAVATVKRNSTSEMLEAITQNNRTWFESFSSNLSEATRKVYQSDILNFLVFLAKDATEITAEAFIRFTEKLKENGVGAKAINKKLSAIRSFIKHLIKIGQLENNPLADVSFLDEGETVVAKTVLTWEQVKQCKDLDGMKFEIFEAGYLLGLSLEEAAKKLDMTVNKFQYNIKKLGDEINVPTLKYSDLIETRNKYFAVCPKCGEMEEMSEGNWKFVDGMMVCKNH